MSEVERLHSYRSKEEHVNTYLTNRLQTCAPKQEIDPNVKEEDLDPKVLEVLKKTKGAFIIGKKKK